MNPSRDSFDRAVLIGKGSSLPMGAKGKPPSLIAAKILQIVREGDVQLV